MGITKSVVVGRKEEKKNDGGKRTREDLSCTNEDRTVHP